MREAQLRLMEPPHRSQEGSQRPGTSLSRLGFGGRGVSHGEEEGCCCLAGPSISLSGPMSMAWVGNKG